MSAQSIDLRAAARALLAGRRSSPLALAPDALERILAIARADGPVPVPVPAPVASDEPQAALGRRAGPDVRGGVAIVPLHGIITPAPSFLSMLFGGGSGGLRGFRLALREALGSNDVEAIVLDVDSPGGLIDLVPETAAEVRAARGDKPIVAVANTLAASAAYWIAAQADSVVVTPSGDVGSIGVYVVHEDWSAWNERFGIAPTYISAGRYKVEGNPDEPLSEEARAAKQQMVDDLYSLFVEDVAAGRGTTAAKVRDGYGEGRVLPAARAVEAKLADRVATIDEVVLELARGDRPRGRRADASDGQRKIHAEGDNPELNGTPQVPEEVRARIAALEQVRPPVAL